MRQRELEEPRTGGGNLYGVFKKLQIVQTEFVRMRLGAL